jgi:hypothetical protein
MKITFPHVEDYLEVIAGKKALPGSVALVSQFWSVYAPIISLARYDNNFLDNVTDQTINGGALTDRQAELAVKLITKYRRQLHAHNVDVPDMTVPTFRRALRIVDRSKSAGVVDDRIYLKFPYDSKTIDVIRSMSKQSQGSMLFDRENKIWKMALTEYNVNWVYEYAKQNDFTIDQRLQDLMQKIIVAENQGYEILLTKQDHKLQITNAHENLIKYLEKKIGPFESHNTNRLIDYASILGYQVSQDLVDQAEEQFGGSTLLLMMNREYDFNQGENIEQRVIDYASVVNRYPIVVFNPTATQNQEQWTKKFNESEVQFINNTSTVEIDPNAKLIYTQKALKNMSSIPLLVSYVGMMIGTEKQLMSVAAEKIFFTAKKLK